ncbi:MAG TPA: cytochrome c3 family protein [Terriglobales bacterium]|nr:cytochrome c3 family protein [Terriglobales bacterium]
MKYLRVVLMLILVVMVVTSMSFARVDKALIINGPHDLRATGSGGVATGSTGASYALCNYCHIAHKFASDGGLGPNGPAQLLWNHTLSSSTAYTAYTSWTQQATDLKSLQATGTDADTTNPSILCMSCHDGTVALNSTYTGAIGAINALPTTRVINPADANKTHPVNFTYDATLASNAGMKVPAGPNGVDVNTGNAVVPLYAGKMQCSTCHEPHTNSHLLFRNFAAVYTATNGSWCLYCHSDGTKNPG